MGWRGLGNQGSSGHRIGVLARNRLQFWLQCLAPFYRRLPVGFRGTLRAAPGLPQLVGQRSDAVFVEMLDVQKCLPGMLQGTS